jgi:hypothetical protein
VKIETADESVARKGAQWKHKPKLFRTKDVGRQGLSMFAPTSLRMRG